MRFLPLIAMAVSGLLLSTLPAAAQTTGAPPATTFLLVDKNDDGTPRARRLFKPIADLVTQRLRKKGYRPIAKADSADIVVDVQFQAHHPQDGVEAVYTSRESDPGFNVNDATYSLTIQMFDPLRDGMVFDRTVSRKTAAAPTTILSALVADALQNVPPASD